MKDRKGLLLKNNKASLEAQNTGRNRGIRCLEDSVPLKRTSPSISHKLIHKAQKIPEDFSRKQAAWKTHAEEQRATHRADAETAGAGGLLTRTGSSDCSKPAASSRPGSAQDRQADQRRARRRQHRAHVRRALDAPWRGTRPFPHDRRQSEASPTETPNSKGTHKTKSFGKGHQEGISTMWNKGLLNRCTDQP